MGDVIYLSIMISHLLICILSVLLVLYCLLAIPFFSSFPSTTISLLIRLLNHHRSAHRASRICAKMTSICEDCTFSSENIQRNGKIENDVRTKAKLVKNIIEFDRIPLNLCSILVSETIVFFSGIRNSKPHIPILLNLYFSNKM